MNQPQTYKGLSFYVGWMKGALIYNNSLSPWQGGDLCKAQVRHRSRVSTEGNLGNQLRNNDAHIRFVADLD